MRRDTETAGLDGHSLSSRLHAELLRRLAEDDGFRAELEADPRGVLARWGIHLEAGAVPARVTLPAKEELVELLDQPSDRPPWMAFLAA